MKLSKRKRDSLIQQILSNYLGKTLEAGFCDNLYKNISYVLDNGAYHMENGRFYGEVEGEVKLLVTIDTDSIKYKKQNISSDMNQVENEEKVKFLKLKDGGCFVEYNLKTINIVPNKLDNQENIIFDQYNQDNNKRAFILDENNNLRINYVETIKYNYSKNKMDDQISMMGPTKDRNYSEKIYYYLDGDRSVRHVIRTYLYPEEIIDFVGLTNSDKFIIVDKDNDVSFNPTMDEVSLYSELEGELNDIMYGKSKGKVKTKVKRNKKATD